MLTSMVWTASFRFDNFIYTAITTTSCNINDLH